VVQAIRLALRDPDTQLTAGHTDLRRRVSSSKIVRSRVCARTVLRHQEAIHHRLRAVIHPQRRILRVEEALAAVVEHLAVVVVEAAVAVRLTVVEAAVVVAEATSSPFALPRR
jgi:hypothetical protein